MSWWARSSLRTKIFLAFSALILPLLLATLSFTQLLVGRDAERGLAEELRTTGQVFETLLKERTARLRASSTLLASDFALKRVFATHFDPNDYDPETLASAGLSYRERLGIGLVWMTDEAGTLLAASPVSKRTGQSLATLSPLRQAMDSQAPADTIVEVDGQLFQMVAVPVFGPDVIGFLLLGQAIDDSVATQLKADTRSDVTFLTPSHVFASSAARGGGPPRLPGRRAQQTPFLQRAGNERLLSLALPVRAELTEPLYALVQGSYDKALAPLHGLQWRISAIGALALTGALLIGMLLAGGIVGPVRALVGGMREVLQGNLRFRARLDRLDELGFLARSFNEMVGGLEEREHIKDTFGRFVSRDVAEAVLNDRIPLAGQRLSVSILFQDIRGFSLLGRTLDPAALLRLLNELFSEVVSAVEGEGGTVKQFTGDGVMALFGAPQVYVDHAPRAVRAALDIVRRLERLNRHWQSTGAVPLRIGIGIHSGEVVAGLIGPDARVEYGAVGDSVNVACRIEEHTKELGATILVSKAVVDQLGAGFELGATAEISLKGTRDVLPVVEVLALHEAKTRAG
jgi:adenylate cyclase